MESFKNVIALLIIAIIGLIGLGVIGFIVHTLYINVLGLTTTDFFTAAGVISVLAGLLFIGTRAVTWAHRQLTK